MEQKQSVKLDDGTEISIDPDRRYTHFLRVTNGPARLDFSLTTASALHDMLNDYFGAPDPIEVFTASEEKPINVLPLAGDALTRLRDSLVRREAEAA